MKFHKKPDVYEAFQWSGSNWHELYAEFQHRVAPDGENLKITATPTSEEYTAKPGDWIIRDTHGRILPPLSDESFHAKYVPVPFV